MTNLEAAQILRDHKEEGTYMPELLGQAIDTAIAALEQPEPSELEQVKAALLILFPFLGEEKFMCVDANSEARQFLATPEEWSNFFFSEPGSITRFTKLPDGIDFRDCIIEK